MGIYWCEGCQNTLDNDHVPQHVNELCEDCAVRVEGWVVTYNPKPIPSRADDWDYYHEDYDGPEDDRCGTARSEMAALLDILEYLDDQEYMEWKARVDAESPFEERSWSQVCRGTGLSLNRHIKPLKGGLHEN